MQKLQAWTQGLTGDQDQRFHGFWMPAGRFYRMRNAQPPGAPHTDDVWSHARLRAQVLQCPVDIIRSSAEITACTATVAHTPHVQRECAHPGLSQAYSESFP